MKQQSLHPSYYRVTAQQLHKSFLDSLKKLKDVKVPEAREIYTTDVKDIYKQATSFLEENSDHLCVNSRSLLQHIVARDLESHLAIANVNSNNMIATY